MNNPANTLIIHALADLNQLPSKLCQDAGMKLLGHGLMLKLMELNELLGRE